MKVTLREIFLLTVIVALSLGWWIDHRRLERENWQTLRQMADQYEELSANVVAEIRAKVVVMEQVKELEARLKQKQD
jgi:predicted DNA-binding ribbon-helix-helix protein